MYLPDVNLWLALAFASHKHHRAASAWFAGVAERDCAFCRLTQLGLLRLSTTPGVLTAKGLTLVKAWNLYDGLFSDPRVVFSEEPADVEADWRDYTGRRTVSPKVWNDAYLAAFARVASYELVTFDQAFKQYKGVRCTVLS